MSVAEWVCAVTLLEVAAQHLVDVVGVWFPSVLAALTVIPVFFIGKALFNRWAGVLALVAGLTSLVDGVLLLQATSRVRPSVVPLTSVLNILAVGSKMESYLSIPMGIALIVGGIMTLRAVRVRVEHA